MRVLMIEDDSADAEAMRRSLAAGAEVNVAGSMQEGTRELQSGKRYDLIIADLKLPDEESSKVVPKLRELAPNIPVVVSSGYADEVGFRPEQQGALAVHQKNNGQSLLAAILQHTVATQDAINQRHQETLLRATEISKQTAREAAQEAVESTFERLHLADTEGLRLAVQHARTLEHLKQRFWGAVVMSIAAGILGAIAIGIVELIKRRGTP